MFLLRLFFLTCLMWSFLSGTAQDDASRNEMIREMYADINYLASDALEGRAVGTRGEKMAAAHIAGRMEVLGLKPYGDAGTFYQHFSVVNPNPHNVHFTPANDSSIDGRNVIGYIDHGADHIVVIGAHYDHLGDGTHAMGSLYDGGPAIHNGADDNASGIAAMLQLAEICRDRFTSNNFLFIAFSGEERGLWGSSYFVKNPLIDLSDVNYMINMDMVGRLNNEKILSVNAVGTSPAWMTALESIHVDSIEIVTTESGIGASDHTSFYLAEIPALHFFTGQHHDYHKPSDDPEKINYAGLVSVVRFIEELIAELNDDGRLAYRETKDDSQRMARDFSVTLGVMPDYLYTSGGMRIDGVRPDRPADKAGIQKGDIVLRMGDKDVTDMQSYMEALNAFEPGQTIPVLIRRDSLKLEKQVTFD